MGVRRQIAGKDVLLFIDPTGGTSYYLIVCLTSNSLERTTAEISAASKCGASTSPGEKTVKVGFEFFDVLDTTTGEVSEEHLHNLWDAGTTVGWKFGVTSPAAGDVTYTGTGFISQLNTVADTAGDTKSTGAIGVYGTPTQTRTGS